MDKSGNCMPRGSKDYEVHACQLLCGTGIPGKDEGFEKGNFLDPCLSNYIIFYKIVYIKCMRIFLASIGYYMLVRVVRIIHL